MKNKIFIVSLLVFLCCPALTFSETVNSESGKTIEENCCGANKGTYDTIISRCFGKTVALIGIISSEEKNGQNIYFLERPIWGDRSRLSFPSKNNHFEVSPNEYGPDVPKIFVEFKKGVDFRGFFKRQVMVIGKIDSKESTLPEYFGAYGDPGDKPRMIILEVEQIKRYIPPETWVWVDNNLPKFKSKEVIKEGVTKTAKFMPAGINSKSDCLFLDSPVVKDQFKKIVLEGTENGYWKEYLASNIEMTARGTLEKRVYDLGECCHCPPGAMCDCSPCGEHTSECINPEEIWK